MTTNQSEKLDLFRDTARGCVDCRDLRLIHYDKQFGWAYPVFHERTTCPSRVLVVAEAPNWDDTYDRSKRRLTYDIETDETGNFARELFASVGLAACDVLFTNSVLCLPARQGKKHPVRATQGRNCLKWLSMAISSCNARVVVTLGGAALRAVGRVSRHGLTLESSSGKPHVWNNRYLLPLYHPGRLGRVTRPAEQQMADIQPLKGLLLAGDNGST
jgi:uracil-DNA glycosylase family 4